MRLRDSLKEKRLTEYPSDSNFVLLPILLEELVTTIKIQPMSTVPDIEEQRLNIASASLDAKMALILERIHNWLCSDKRSVCSRLQNSPFTFVFTGTFHPEDDPENRVERVGAGRPVQ